ncbi:MAG: gfo/Idh/MocA family oxidoreductase, partial [Lentisphaerae bacterium]
LIVTPPTTQYRLGLRALQAGKHLLLDKPLAFTTAEVDDLIRTANAGDLILSTNLVLRVHPVHRYIRTLVREKTFGDLLQISSTALLGKYPDDHWYWDELRSGGFFLNTFSHFLDLFDFVSGEVPVEQVTNGNPLNGYQLFGVYSSGVQFSLSASLQVDGLAEHVMTHYIFERAVISTTGWVPETMKIVDVESGNHFWTDANRDSAYRQALAAIQADFQRQIRYGVRSVYELTPLTLRNSVHIPKLFENALPSVESEADDVTGTFSENGLA